MRNEMCEISSRLAYASCTWNLTAGEITMMKNVCISQLCKLVKLVSSIKNCPRKKKKSEQEKWQKKPTPVVEVDAELEEDENVDWGSVYSNSSVR